MLRCKGYEVAWTITSAGISRVAERPAADARPSAAYPKSSLSRTDDRESSSVNHQTRELGQWDNKNEAESNKENSLLPANPRSISSAEGEIRKIHRRGGYFVGVAGWSVCSIG